MSLMVNLNPDPSCLKEAWWKHQGTIAAQDSDGRWKYSCKDTTSPGIAFAPTSKQFGRDRFGKVMVGIVECSQAQNTFPITGLSTCRNLCRGTASDRRFWIAGEMYDGGALAHELQFIGNQYKGWVKLLGSAVYTMDDWLKVKRLVDDGQLPYPWWGTPTKAVAGSPMGPVLIP